MVHSITIGAAKTKALAEAGEFKKVDTLTVTVEAPKAELTKISKEQRKQINDTMYEQLAYAGYRLAGTLNKIFSK